MNKFEIAANIAAKKEIMRLEIARKDDVGLMVITQFNNRRPSSMRSNLESRCIYKTKRKTILSDKMTVKFGV